MNCRSRLPNCRGDFSKISRWLLCILLMSICTVWVVSACAEPYAVQSTAEIIGGSQQTRAVIARGDITQIDPAELGALYDALLSGVVVQKGSSGDYVRTLQKLLNALGDKLAVDGSIGAKTISAMSETLQNYTCAPSERLAQLEFDRLIFALAASRDETFALAVYGEGRGNDVQYARAAGLTRSGLFYSAYQIFRKLELDNFADSSARAAACPQKWPQTGELFHADEYQSGECSLVIRTNQSVDGATMVVVRDESGAIVSGMFIEGASSAKAMLPHGNYSICVGTGSVWFGEAEAFGTVAGAEYSRITFSGGAAVMTLETGYETTLALDVNAHDEGAMSVWADALSLSQFIAGQ